MRARRGWTRRSWLDVVRALWPRLHRIAYAIAEVSVGLVYILGIPAFLWWMATR